MDLDMAPGSARLRGDGAGRRAPKLALIDEWAATTMPKLPLNAIVLEVCDDEV